MYGIFTLMGGSYARLRGAKYRVTGCDVLKARDEPHWKICGYTTPGNECHSESSQRANTMFR